MADNQNLFARLTRLFRSGPVVKRKVRGFEPTVTNSTIDLFKKSQNSAFTNAISAYGMYDRMSRYADFAEMEHTPEIAAALDIYSDETVATDEKGQSVHIYSNNAKIRKTLDDLFLDTLNLEFNLNPWTRNLCKYGDFFLFLDVSPEYGVQNAFPIPVNEIEREEGYDPEDPMAVRFRWVTQGNKVLENWQIAHFRLLGNDAFLPYGSSVIEPARRVWRQLILIEDAMLVYRVIRSPERRVFYIDVGNVPPEEIPNYMEQAKSALKSAQVVDKKTGRVDLRYNPLSVDEDYFIPVRGSDSPTKVDTLAGGQNTTAIEDVEYIQKKLFAALKIPKAYLGYDEALSSKATLAQEDIRFSRTINKIQRVMIAELNKIAAIHLFSHGYEGEDLLDFQIYLSNPSTIAQQQKLELFRAKFEIAGQAPEGMLSRDYLRKSVLGLTSEEIDKIEEQKEEEKLRDLELEAVTLPPADEEGGEGGGGDLGGEDLGGEEAEEPPAEEETPGLEVTGRKDDLKGRQILDSDPEEVKIKLDNSSSKPLKARSATKKAFDGRNLPNPIAAKRLSARDPFISSTDIRRQANYSAPALPRRLTELDLIDQQEMQHQKMTSRLKSTLKRLQQDIDINVAPNTKTTLLKETVLGDIDEEA